MVYLDQEVVNADSEESRVDGVHRRFVDEGLLLNASNVLISTFYSHYFSTTTWSEYLFLDVLFPPSPPRSWVVAYTTGL